MQRTTPPFRADHVGSLLRPAAVKDARGKRERSEITADALRAVEDREIEKVDQKAGGDRTEARDRRRVPPLLVAFRLLQRSRRRHASTPPTTAFSFTACRPSTHALKIDGKLGFSGHPMLEHFKFLKAHTRVTPKMTIPAPSTLHFRQGRAAISKEVYPDLDPFFRRSRQGLSRRDPRLLRRRLPLSAARRHRLGDGVRSERARAFERARRRSRRAAAALCAPHQRGARGQTCRHGDHHAFVPRQFPLHLHRVRRLRVRRRAAARPYRPRRLFPRIRQRPRRRLRAAALLSRRARSSWCSVSSPRKAARWRRKDDIKRRIDEATKYVALDQLCLSPQCGFASTEEGNVLAEDEQWAKLADDRRNRQ